MTPREKEVTKILSDIFLCARKNATLGQTQIAKRLGVSQSMVSKIEKAALMPSALVWMDAADIFQISHDSYREGYIDNEYICKINSAPSEKGYKLPERYISNRGIALRVK